MLYCCIAPKQTDGALPLCYVPFACIQLSAEDVRAAKTLLAVLIHELRNLTFGQNCHAVNVCISLSFTKMDVHISDSVTLVVIVILHTVRHHYTRVRSFTEV